MCTVTVHASKADRLCWQGPPESKWERATADAAGLARTWGLKHAVLAGIKDSCPAMVEIQSRLAKLYPDCTICHMPAEAIQQEQPADVIGPLNTHQNSQGKRCKQDAGTHDTDRQVDAQTASADQQALEAAHKANGAAGTPAGDDSADHGSSARPQADCDIFVGNAAVHGDSYTWHVDADPAAFPDSIWTAQYGAYCNREPGKPLFVSLLLYLNDAWAREWDAETLFLDADTDVGLVVRPKRCELHAYCCWPCLVCRSTCLWSVLGMENERIRPYLHLGSCIAVCHEISTACE